MKIDRKKVQHVSLSFSQKIFLQMLPLSIPKVEDNFKGNQAYWEKSGKTESLEIKITLLNL